MLSLMKLFNRARKKEESNGIVQYYKKTDNANINMHVTLSTNQSFMQCKDTATGYVNRGKYEKNIKTVTQSET